MNHLRNILIILLLALLSSCVSIDKAIKVATKNDANAEATQYALNQKHRLIVAENCASLFPIKESTETETETIQGNSEQLKQELANVAARADSLERHLAALPVKPECQPEVLARDKVIVDLRGRIATLNALAANLQADVQRVTTTKTQENMATVAAGMEREKELMKELKQERTKREAVELKALEEGTAKSNWRTGCIALLLIGAGFVLFKIFR